MCLVTAHGLFGVWTMAMTKVIACIGELGALNTCNSQFWHLLRARFSCLRDQSGQIARGLGLEPHQCLRKRVIHRRHKYPGLGVCWSRHYLMYGQNGIMPLTAHIERSDRVSGARNKPILAANKGERTTKSPRHRNFYYNILGTGSQLPMGMSLNDQYHPSSASLG